MKTIEEVVNRFGLGQPCEEAKKVSGGLLHKMYHVITTKGTYAVKVLNSEIMKRPTALRNMINSERVATALTGSVPVVAALEIQGRQVHELDGTYYMIYPWVEGRSVFPGEIQREHCEIIGDLLGRIHGMNISVEGLEPEADEAVLYPWEEYLQVAQEQAKGQGIMSQGWTVVSETEEQDLRETEQQGMAEDGRQGKYIQKLWIAHFEAALQDICTWNQAVCDAQGVLAMNLVVSHRDLDPKNVMWQDEQALLIDWEAAGYVNPYQELLEVVNYWADDGQGSLVQEYAEAIVEAYKKYHDLSQVSWSEVFAGSYAGMLGWLEYNVKRALGMEAADEEEMRLGAEQVEGTIRALYEYQEKQEVLLHVLMD